MCYWFIYSIQKAVISPLERKKIINTTTKNEAHVKLLKEAFGQETRNIHKTVFEETSRRSYAYNTTGKVSTT